MQKPMDWLNCRLFHVRELRGGSAGSELLVLDGYFPLLLPLGTNNVALTLMKLVSLTAI